MRRLHVHLNVTDLDSSIRFYESLFGAGPSVRKSDYAKWQLEDPCVNFAISLRKEKAGLNHLGIQVSEREELSALHDQLRAADISTRDQSGANCCYAVSDKHWAVSPEGVAWEAFHTMDQIAVYGADKVDLACCDVDAGRGDLADSDDVADRGALANSGDASETRGSSEGMCCG